MTAVTIFRSRADEKLAVEGAQTGRSPGRNDVQGAKCGVRGSTTAL